MEDNSGKRDWHSFDFYVVYLSVSGEKGKNSQHQGWNFFNTVFRNPDMHMYIYMKLLKKNDV